MKKTWYSCEVRTPDPITGRTDWEPSGMPIASKQGARLAAKKLCDTEYEVRIVRYTSEVTELFWTKHLIDLAKAGGRELMEFFSSTPSSSPAGLPECPSEPGG